MSKYLPILLLFIFFACGKKKDLYVPEPEVIKGNFYPLNKGDYRLYEVRQSTYVSAQRSDSVYRIKEVLADTFMDMQGETSFKILRFRTRPPADTFALDSVWYVKVSRSEVVKTENNIPFCNLSYPLMLHKAWNGNKFNAYSPEYYKVTTTAESYQSFKNIIEVTQRDDSSLLRRDLRKEMYAQDIGLVYKLTRMLNFSSSGADFGQGVIIGGVIREQKLIGYGQK